MEPRRKAALLWGVVGTLSSLVVTQGYRLFAEPPFGPLVQLAVAVVVGAVVAVVGFRFEARLARNERV